MREINLSVPDSIFISVAITDYLPVHWHNYYSILTHLPRGERLYIILNPIKVFTSSTLLCKLSFGEWHRIQLLINHHWFRCNNGLIPSGNKQAPKWMHADHVLWAYRVIEKTSQITKFMGPTWGPPGSCRPQMGPMLAPWPLLSGLISASDQDINPMCQLSSYLQLCWCHFQTKYSMGSNDWYCNAA